MSERITPKYLTFGVVEAAVRDAFLVFSQGGLANKVSKPCCHIVVLVPSIEDDRTLDPVFLHEESLGDKSKWTSPYDNIARSKALQLWFGQNVEGNADCIPHLLFPGDTPWWGGVKRHGIVVACSGVQSYFDQLMAGMVADLIKAYARHEWELSREKADEVNFLS